MSFSSDIKQELNKNSNLNKKELVKYELIGYLISGNTDCINKSKIKFSTESDYNINRYSKLLTNLDIDHNIDIVGKTFYIVIKTKDIEKIEEIEIEENKTKETKEIKLKTDSVNKEGLEKNEENLRAIIKGIFMGSGSINNPEKEYHLEIDISNKENLENIIRLLNQVEINVKNMSINNKLSIYIKEGEEISKFLALIGANKAVMQFEEIRIQKEMRGKVNRLVNCETANLNKTMNASIEQITAIEKLKEKGKFNLLDENLKEIAILRTENPNMSLIELGKLLKTPLGKSGVNYRLKKLVELANDI